MIEEIVQVIEVYSYDEFIDSLNSCETLDLEYKAERTKEIVQGLLCKKISRTKYTIEIINRKSKGEVQ